MQAYSAKTEASRKFPTIQYTPTHTHAHTDTSITLAHPPPPPHLLRVSIEEEVRHDLPGQVSADGAPETLHLARQQPPHQTQGVLALGGGGEGEKDDGHWQCKRVLEYRIVGNSVGNIFYWIHRCLRGKTFTDQS